MYPLTLSWPLGNSLTVFVVDDHSACRIQRLQLGPPRYLISNLYNNNKKKKLHIRLDIAIYISSSLFKYHTKEMSQHQMTGVHGVAAAAAAPATASVWLLPLLSSASSTAFPQGVCIHRRRRRRAPPRWIFEIKARCQVD
ncbi:hypothetical protein V9T40_014940 [Parthenolecanium corni]|uniref:Uncharacterized protein n=1 Tax=Parthenolecanium corni TaxID=536013 RepID=A0AAN9TZ59_9HEMI